MEPGRVLQMSSNSVTNPRFRYNRSYLVVTLLLLLLTAVELGMAFSMSRPLMFHGKSPAFQTTKSSCWHLFLASKESNADSPTTITSSEASTISYSEDDDDNGEYEYMEYERLTEAEFVKSEWLVGTNWDKSQDRIDETWVRLITTEDGKNLAYWGDNSEGKWSLDVASQFLSISKENPWWGKNIWAGVVDDYYYLQGTVRGWTFWQSASVLAQWQAKRLGVDPQEAGTPPWFQEQDNSNDEENP